MNHPNSKLAHAKLSSDRHAAVLECYRQHGPLTDRAVAMMLAGANADPNVARPRITELVTAGILLECGSVKDATTGSKVRQCRLRETTPTAYCPCMWHLDRWQRVPSQKHRGKVAVVCTSPVHGEGGKFLAYEDAQ